MKQILSELKITLQKSLAKGIIYILGSSLINKLLQFGMSIIFIRLLSKNDFGILSYSLNILAFLLMFSVGGINTGLLQFASYNKNVNERQFYLKYSIITGVIFGLVTIFIVTFLGLLEVFPIEASNKYIILLSGVPLLYIIFQQLSTWLRIEIRNKAYAYLSNAYTLLYFIISITGAYFIGIKGIIIGKYISFILAIIIGIKLNYRELISSIKLSFNKVMYIKFMKFSLISMITNSLSHFMIIIDVFIVGLMTNATLVAEYKTATFVPFALLFIPNSIMMFVYPHIAKNMDNVKWIKSNYIKLLLYLFILNVIITMPLLIFSPLIIKILFGEQYIGIIPLFRILCVGYIIAGTFRVSTGHILSAIRKVKYTLYGGIIQTISAVVLNIILIKFLSIKGAAIATLLTFIIGSIFINVYLMFHLNKKNK